MAGKKATAFGGGYSDPQLYANIAKKNPGMIAQQYDQGAKAMGLSNEDYYQYLAAKNTPGSDAAQLMAQNLYTQGQQGLTQSAIQNAIKGQQPSGFQMPQFSAQAPVASVPVTPLAASAQYGAATQGAPAAPAMNVPQANAGATAPLFSLGSGQSWMLPQAQAQPQSDQQQPLQRFQSGGSVQQMIDPWTGQPVTGEQAGLANLGLYGAYPQGSAQAEAIKQMGSPIQAGAMYQPYFLGAAALQSPPVINLPPSGTPSSKSGVAATPGAIIGTGVPQIPQGPWATQPGVFARAPMPTVSSAQSPGWTVSNPNMPLTAQTPANAAQMPQMTVTPAANAQAAVPQMTVSSGYTMPTAGRRMPPAAPGGWQAMPVQQPYGGATAQGANVALATGPRPMSAFEQGFQHGASGMAPTPPAQPVQKMQTGGYVQSLGQLPATVGDWEAQNPPRVADWMAQNPPRVADWEAAHPAPYTGTVQNDPYMSHAVSTLLGLNPKPLHWHQQQPARIGQPSQEPGKTQSLGQLPATVGDWMATHPAQAQRATPATVGDYMANPPPSNANVAASSRASAPNIGTLAGEQAYVTGEPVSGIPKGGMTPQMGNALAGGIASAGQQLAQGIASSVQPWRIQPSAIPNPDDFRRQPQITLQQPTVV